MWPTRAASITRLVLIVLEVVVALNALGGGCYGLAGAPAVPREWLRGTPFQDYFVPSLILVVGVAGSMTTAVALLLARHRRAAHVSIAAGIVLTLWITVQVAMIGYVSWLQPAMLLAGLGVITLAVLMARWTLEQPIDGGRATDSG